ncbi:hypothetical protein HDU85_003050 [Gaertneriomyces sp. JEL0708]|nr:hypothetical protein HDU85_003050 [Gaertneriomyces sp. JEL0708]
MTVVAPTLPGSVLVSAPGKVILFGEHAVVYGKTAVAASLGLRTYAWIRRTTGDSVVLTFPDLSPEALIRVEFTIEELKQWRMVTDATKDPMAVLSAASSKLLVVESVSGAAKQAAAAFLTVYLALVDELMPMDVCVRSFLPVGAGLGSSASFSVCIATGLLLLTGRLSKTVGLSETELNTINDWAFCSEKVIHGNPSGIDNSLCTYGGAKLYSKGVMRDLKGFTTLKFVLTDTQVPKNTKVQVEGVRLRKEKFPDIVTPILESIEALVTQCENSFSPSADEAQLEESLETLVDINHSLLSAIGVSHPSLEAVRQTSARFGLKSKLTGAGGGGCALTLIRHDTTLDTIEEFKNALECHGCRSFEAEVGCEGLRCNFLSDADAMRWTDFVDRGLDSAQLDALIKR